MKDHTDAMHQATTTQIPRLAHFTWGMLGDSGEMPDRLRSCFEAWKLSHPHWQIEVHGNDEAQRLAQEYPQLPLNEYRLAIQRCDAIRPMLLHKYGGVYSDLDIEPHKTMDELFSYCPGAGLIVAVETIHSKEICEGFAREQPIRGGQPELPVRMANCLMASRPGHPFWLDVMALMKRRQAMTVSCDYDVIYTTGPDIITEAIYQMREKYSDIFVIPGEIMGHFVSHYCASGWRGMAQSQARVPSDSRLQPAKR